MAGSELGLRMLEAVKGYVSRSLIPISSRIDAMEKLALEAVPIPRDGVDGDKGDPGRDGRDGKDGKDGRDGIDGINGKDALYVEEFSAELKEDGRTVVFMLSSGGKQYRSEIVLAIPQDCGVYKQQRGYQRGDSVTWDGSLWIAQKITSDKPGTSDAWRLAVKRGRDGKDLRVEEPSKPVPVRLI